MAATRRTGQFQQVSNLLAGTTLTTSTLPSSINAGSAIAIGIDYDTTPGVSDSVADDLSVAALSAGVSTTAGGFSQVTVGYYYKNYGGGARTFTLSTPNNNTGRYIGVVEVQGADTVAPLGGVSSGASGGSTAASSGNVSPTPAVNGAYIFGVLVLGGVTSATETNSFQPIQNDNGNTGTFESDLAQGTAAAVAATWTLGAIVAWEAIAFVLLPAAAAGGQYRARSTRAVPGARGPYDRRGFLFKPKFNYAESVSSSFAQTLTPNAVSSTWTVATPTLVLGAVGLTPSAIGSTWSVATPTLIKTRTLLPSAVSSTWSIATPSLIKGTRTLLPNAVVSTWSVATPSIVTGGTQTKTPSAISSTWSIATPSVTRGPRVLATSAISSAWSIAAPSLLRGPRVLLPNALVSTWSIAAPTLTKGPRTLLPSAAASSWGVIPPTVSGGGTSQVTVRWIYMGHRAHRTGNRPPDKDIY